MDKLTKYDLKIHNTKSTHILLCTKASKKTKLQPKLRNDLDHS